jgi:hypothetical protein
MRRIVLATAVVLVAIGVLPSASAKESPVRGTDMPGLWVDTSGVVLGPLVADYSVLVRLDRHVVVVYLGGDNNSGGVRWPLESHFLIYAEPNCGGQAYVPDNFTTFGGDAGVVIAGPAVGQYTMFVGAAAGETVVTQWMLFGSGECRAHDSGPLEWFARPVEATYDLSNFKPPFRLR